MFHLYPFYETRTYKYCNKLYVNRSSINNNNDNNDDDNDDDDDDKKKKM